MNRLILGLSIFIVITLSNCSLDIEQNKRLDQPELFSTEKYFAAEKDRLADKRGFTKYVNFNGKEEMMKLDSLNFDQEFIPFINTDINKVIWSDQYTCDSTFTNNTLDRINCSCLNKKLKTRSLEVNIKNNEVESIRIECMLQKMLMETMEYLTYEKDAFYQIKRIQTLETGVTDSTIVKVYFR